MKYNVVTESLLIKKIERRQRCESVLVDQKDCIRCLSTSMRVCAGWSAMEQAALVFRHYLSALRRVHLINLQRQSQKECMFAVCRG